MADFTKSLNIENPENWGKLIKSWATGRNYFAEGQPAPAIPNSIEELLQQCTDYECGVTVAEWVKGLAVFRYDKGTLGIRLPPPDLIDRSEKQIRDNASSAAEGASEALVYEPHTYPLPEFYLKFLRIRPTDRDVDVLLNFHHARIGEYTVNSCM
ncbi:MAG: hypothetical protein ACRCTD_05080 [Beijerinckiaceae bacterium]